MNQMQSFSPVTGELLWEGKAATPEVVAEAIKSAREAFTQWAFTPLEERIGILERYVDLLKARREQIAETIANENGKVWREANAEVGALIAKVAISIDAYHQRTGEVTVEMDGGVRRSLSHRPLGVMVVFGPYNFPMHLPNGHIIPALIAGNTVVFKPSEETPLCGEMLVSLLKEAGLPEGVVSVVHGTKETGVALTSHPDIAGVLFTGSYPTGKAIHQALAGRPEVMLALEMGGNNPLIVHEVNDVAATAAMIAESGFATTGQRCTCARRLIIPVSEEGNQIVDALAAVIDELSVGAPMEQPEPYMGPLINNMQAEHVLQGQSHLRSLGARSVRQVKRLHQELPYLSAGLIDITAVDGVPDEEIFGPLLKLIRVRDMEEAVAVANDTAYGLSAGVISDNTTHWEYAYTRLKAGIVNYNRPLTGASSASPFGGPGKSGNYRPSAYYAADYCAYPVATLASDQVGSMTLPGLRPVV